ncbi:Pre-mrna-splicing factor syf1 [Thalictrum thalictroides]|uniref:Pre-mrna-splicing factor syf1 n=1 Tax=Thalictrum thalictroides TaxID=46969 RepID=A0A7J6VJX4_THATH|nr:Pre-mrna-splicing factor syf1 [Thalictrum thalictroides]
MNYTSVDHIVSLWVHWAEMKLRHKNFSGALELMRRATTEPSLEVRQRLASVGYEPVQMKLHKSLRLWAFYVDLEESLGTLESARIVYERMLDLKIVPPLVLISYACLLEEHKLFEEAFEVYERGVKMFEYPHVKEIWITYISKFVKRYGKIKLERVRELFGRAREMIPAEFAKPLYLLYVKLEEDFGLAKCAMKWYDQAAKSVLGNNEKMSIYEKYIARAAKIFGVPKTRKIYELAQKSGGLPDKDVQLMCMKYADLENSLGEIDKGRAIYTFASQFADPQYDADFWSKWLEFEVRHGNPSTLQDMLLNKHTDDDESDIVQEDIPSKLKVVETNKDKHRQKDTNPGAPKLG